MMDKKELRKMIRERKRQFSAAQLRDMSKEIMCRLLAMSEIEKSSTIMMYYSLDDEVDTHETIDRLVADGKTVLLPAVTSGTEMELRQYTCPEDLKTGAFNIKEPAGRLFTDYESIDVAIIPGMGFDEEGNRLGRGKGYYDRFLPKIPRAYKIGVCFPFQKFPAIPYDSNDVKMDIVVE
mgnify:CR=1 FL=1